MYPRQVNYAELEQWLERTPVMAETHVLTPLCFSRNVHITADADLLLDLLDDRDQLSDGAVMVLGSHTALAARFPYLVAPEHPPVEAINRHFGDRLDYARTHLMTTRTVSAAIADDAVSHAYDAVALLLVDGLSYGDVKGWPGEIVPCFVDGPSVTYRFDLATRSRVLQQVGFAAIVGEPRLFERLYAYGYTNAHGFTYWSQEENRVTECLFRGLPLTRAVNFESILMSLRNSVPSAPVYLQIMREGLDGLAHSKRELDRREIEAAVAAIRHDLERLADLLVVNYARACIYLVADHGILWKKEHDWHSIPTKGCKPRYASSTPDDETLMANAVRLETDDVPYYTFRYPYLGANIPANDSGVHGGLSYQESLVPFGKFEV